MQMELKNVQVKLDKPIRSIPSYSSTRWWSLLKLLEVYVEQQLPLIEVLSSWHKGKLKENILTQKELGEIKDMIEIIKPFQNVSENMSGEKYVTLSVIIPILNHTQDTVKETLAENITLKNSIQDNIFKVLEDRYKTDNNFDLILRKSTFLDPRFKDQALDEEVQHEIEIEMDTLNVNVQEKPKLSEKKTGLAVLLKKRKYDEDDKEQNIFSSYEEISNYKSCREIDVDENVLNWWKLNSDKYPRLSILAKKYLSPPATSVPCERIFSCGGNIITDNRASLSPEHSEQLIFLSMNKDFIKN